MKKGEWYIDAAGRTVLNTASDSNADLVAIQAQRDQATAQLEAVQKAHDALLAQVRALEAAINAAGTAITAAEPT